MEPVQKKARITDHFRVALKPQNINIQPTLNKFKKFKKGPETVNKENIEVITIEDDDDDEDDNNHKRKNCCAPLARLSSQQQQQSQPQLQQEATNVKLLNLVETTSEKLKIFEQEQELDEDEEEDLSIDSSINNDEDTSIYEQQQRLLSEYQINRYISPPGLSANVTDHDRLMLFDIHCEPHYAWDSFQYDREQEGKFRSRKYLDDEKHENKITPRIRARLVDWLVEMQDIFKLYHESLYMAVKIADQYLMKKTCKKEELQLLYLASIFISAKFDERLPPVEIDDLIEQSGGVYTRKQITSFEVDILSTLDFNIRFPLSYGFLRRFARCTRSSKKALNLARYILESSLLDYDMIEVLESEIAAAALLLAFEMLHQDGAWTETAEFYTGFKQEELYPLLTRLNDMISRKKISAIRRKYSHEVFLSVARIPPLARS